MKKSLKILLLSFIVILSFAFVASGCSKKNEGDASGNGDTENKTDISTDSGTNQMGQNGGSENKNDNVTFTETTQHTPTNDSVNMSSGTDSFKVLEKSYSADEKFVYTSIVSFENGVAAGLAFGSEDGSHYWVFNIDREANRVKLLYFTVFEGQIRATELLTDYFIGNDKMTESEKRLVNPKVKTIDKVQLKVVITPDGDSVYAEFYADNIRRFGIDNTIELNSLALLPEGVSYEGGSIGFNCL